MKSRLQPGRILLALISVLADAAHSRCTADVQDALAIFDQTTKTVAENFYDPTLRGLPWVELVEASRLRLTGPVQEDTLKATINGLLDRLHTSHTKFLSSSDQEYWAFKSIFSRSIEGGALLQIGAWFVEVDRRWFIRNIFSDSPAQAAGLLSGDEILLVDEKPIQAVNSFVHHPPVSVRVTYRRSLASTTRTVDITPVTESFQSSLLKATLASSHVLRRGGQRIGYFHLWSGTHPKFQDALEKAAVEFSGETDTLILDLRDGFGGAGPAYLNSFLDHDDQGRPIKPVYAKPMVVLINQGTRSGKEWLAHILKTKKRATLVGSRTAGQFIGGKPFDIRPERFLLFLAVDGNGPPGVDLEGKGVQPDTPVAFTLPYSAGGDPQLEAAIAHAALGGSLPLYSPQDAK